MQQAISVTLYAGAAASLALASGVAFAQDQEDEEEVDEVVELHRVQVTGSRIKRVDVEGALPVTVIDREQIELTGESNAADLIRNLTFNSTGSRRPQSGALVPQTVSAVQGVSLVSLRGLGPSRTLVLINGRRMAKAPSFGAAPDLNTIPLAAIERIEILSDGASAVYGSDALSGVINVITRKGFEGAEFMYGMASPNPTGGDREEGSVLFGTTGQSGQIIAGASWNNRDIIFTRDFPWYRPGASVYSNNWTPTAAFTFTELPGACESDTGLSDGTFYSVPSINALNPQRTRCAYNFAQVSADEASIENKSAFAYMRHDISNDWSIYSDVTVTKTNSFGRYAPVPDSNFFTRQATSVNSPNNPTNPESPMFDPALGPPQPIYWWHRFDALGNRDNEVETRLDDVLVGAVGYIGNVELEGGVRYTDNEVYDIGRNYLLRSAAADHIESGAYNLQDPTSTPANVLNSMKVTTSRISTFDQKEWFGTAAWDLFKTNAGPVQWIVGGEYRELSHTDQNDSLSEAGVVGTSLRANSAPVERDVTSFYGEVLIPLFYRFDVFLAARNDDYSDYGRNTSPKVSFRWQPTESLTLRASYGEGFRAPTLDVLSLKDLFTLSMVRDKASCLAQGQSPDCALLVNGRFTANPRLGSEQSEQYSLGVAWEPMDWFFGKVDYYNIEITDRITYFLFQELVNREVAGDPIPPGLGVTRAPNGAIQQIITGWGNEGMIQQDGFDLNLRFDFEVFGGRLSSNFQTSVITSYEIDGGRDLVGDPGVPEFRATLRNKFAIGDFTLAYNINHIDGQCDTIVAAACVGSVPSWTTHDLQARWFAPWEGEVIIGCQNCGNNQPPILVGDIGVRDYDFNLYDGFGRIIYARYKQRF